MEHVVTHPNPPFLSRDGRLEVHQVPAWKDNFVWIARCVETGEAGIIDGPEAGAVLDYCQTRGIQIKAILNTHTHPDHIGINRDLQRRGMLETLTVFGSERTPDKIPGLTDPLADGDALRIGKVIGRVILTEGHLDGHISFVFDDILFCGDTLFTGGCGRPFDGPPATLHESLSTLASLDPATRVCCAHEYTQDNLRFAWSIDHGNEALAERIRSVWALRSQGRSAVPSTLSDEVATNPFLRTEDAALRDRVASAMPDYPMETPAQVFAAARALKDRGDYRKSDDATPLPL